MVASTIIRLFGTELNDESRYLKIRQAEDEYDDLIGPGNKMYRYNDISEQLGLIDSTSHIQREEEGDSFLFSLV